MKFEYTRPEDTKLEAYGKVFDIPPKTAPLVDGVNSINKQIAEGNAASDEETRKGYYKELMELYMEDVPSVAIYANMSAVAHASDLESIDPSSAWYAMYLYKWVE